MIRIKIRVKLRQFDTLLFKNGYCRKDFARILSTQNLVSHPLQFIKDLGGKQVGARRIKLLFWGFSVLNIPVVWEDLFYVVK